MKKRCYMCENEIKKKYIKAKIIGKVDLPQELINEIPLCSELCFESFKDYIRFCRGGKYKIVRKRK